MVLVDGLKRPKEGKKMPGVKSLHQESRCNAKASFIMGHSLQACRGLGSCVCEEDLPCRAACPHSRGGWSGVIAPAAPCWTNWGALLGSTFALGKTGDRSGRRLLCRRQICPGLKPRLRATVWSRGFAPPPWLTFPVATLRPAKRRRTRRALYGHKTKLRDWFHLQNRFIKAPSPVYGEAGVTLRYYTYDLLWRRLGRLVRFVWVIHPTRGQLVLLCTDLTLPPLDIIRLYGWRFKIEVISSRPFTPFGAYAYHFWMEKHETHSAAATARNIPTASPESYRQALRRKARGL